MDKYTQQLNRVYNFVKNHGNTSDKLAVAELEAKTISPLQRDAVPSFYVSQRGLPPCTHRIHGSDIPVWCKTAHEASVLMDMICQFTPAGKVLVPMVATPEIEDAIAASRNLKASEIWEDAVNKAIE